MDSKNSIHIFNVSPLYQLHKNKKRTLEHPFTFYGDDKILPEY